MKSANSHARGLSRRNMLKAMAAGGALAGGNWKVARAQSPRTVRIWSTQSAPSQVKIFNQSAQEFEKANPGIKIALELVSDDDVFPKLVAAHAAGQPPEMCLGVNSYVPATLYGKKLLEPLNDVAEAVGDFTQPSLDAHMDNGFMFALAASLTVIDTMWIRTDLFAAEGLDTPKYWDEYLVAVKKLTKNGIYGTVLPYGGSFASRIVDVFTRQSGGDIIAPDMSVVFNNPGTIKALEFLREVRPYVPAGANNYGFGETLNAFVSGATAIGIYTGRALVNIHAQNPAIESKVKAAFYSYPRDGVPYWACGYDSLFVNKGPRVNVDEVKQFIKYFYQPKPYTAYVLGAPAHNLPVIKKVASSPAYTSNPLLQAHAADIDTMMQIASKAFINIKPTAKHPLIIKMGDVYASNVLAQTLQKVIVDKESPAAAAAWGHERIAAIVKA